MKTLLAVDGSDNSYQAVHALKYFARAEQLTLLHALDVPRPAYPMMRPEAAEELYKTLEQCMREDGERLLGSVSHRILTLAPCATLIVNGPVKAMKQILLPLQGLSDAEAAIRFLQLKPFHEAVELTLMTVLPWTEPPWPSGAAEAAAAAATEMLEKQTEYIEGVAERLCAIGYKAHGVALLGTPSTMILQEAATLRSDLILMGTRGRQGITRFVLGSVSHAVLHKTPCPVLAFH
jgi:nucleotide-binding universal stress UspA family protein